MHAISSARPIFRPVLRPVLTASWRSLVVRVVGTANFVSKPSPECHRSPCASSITPDHLQETAMTMIKSAALVAFITGSLGVLTLGLTAASTFASVS